MQPIKRLAVLIDAENANAAGIANILTTIADYGKAIILRAYGDWTTPQLTPWKKVIDAHGIRPFQQFRLRFNKNASDGALMMDVIELIERQRIDGICIVASDGDYIGLATRAREAGLAVYGFGTHFTPQGFRAACDVFVQTDIAFEKCLL